MAEVVLVQCNLVNNQYQQNSELLYNFTSNKSYGYLLNVEPIILVFLKTYDIEFDYNNNYQLNSRLIGIEFIINLTLLINK